MSNPIDSGGFDGDDVEIKNRELIFDGFFRMEKLFYRHRRYRGDWSPVVEREVLYRGRAVGVLLYDPGRDLIGMIEQIRPGVIGHPPSPWCLEIVAGIVEPGEDLEEVAHREMREEAGVSCDSLHYICEYYPSPGGSDERIYLYFATADLGGVHGQCHGLDSEGEDIKVLAIPAKSVFEHLYEGRFNSSPVLIALQWLQLNIDRFRQE